MTAVEDFLQATMPRLIDAELALHRGDVAGRLAMWSALDPVTLFGAAAPFRSGWDQLEPVFRWLASRFAVSCRCSSSRAFASSSRVFASDAISAAFSVCS